jgi:phosphate starvation-inducible protein PhoH
VPGIGFVTFDRGDVVRHPLVQRIVEAYGEEESKGPTSRSEEDETR